MCSTLCRVHCVEYMVQLLVYCVHLLSFTIASKRKPYTCQYMGQDHNIEKELYTSYFSNFIAQRAFHFTEQSNKLKQRKCEHTIIR